MANPRARGDWVTIPRPNPYPQFATFKYRIWLTLRCAPHSEWISIMDEGFWLWEEDDEKYIEENCRARGIILQSEWLDACRALEARQACAANRTNPWAHLTPETRVRAIMWLLIIATKPVHGGFRERTLSRSIEIWGFEADRLGLLCEPSTYATLICTHCWGHSGFLSVWVETMLKIYSVEDLQMVTWKWRCSCLNSQISAHSRTNQCKQRAERNSAPYRVLYERIVSPWPLILWVMFRGAVGPQRGNFQSFISILERTELQVASWDDAHERQLIASLIGLKYYQISIYPKLWVEYMLELSLAEWQQIHKSTWAGTRARGAGESNGNTRIRLATFFFMCASNAGPIAWPADLLAPLNITLDDPLFASIARVVSKDYKNKLWDPVNLHCDQFWRSSNLRQWLADRNDGLCHTVWSEISESNLEAYNRVRCLDAALHGLPQFLTIFASSIIFKAFESGSAHDTLENLTSKFLSQSCWREREFPDSLVCYHGDFNMLSCSLEPYEAFLPSDPRTTERNSKQIHRDTVALVAKLVLFLRDKSSYKRLLECQGEKAQAILNILQDLLDQDSFTYIQLLLLEVLLRLSRKSALYPRCFPLLGLQMMGTQVAGGGFADIFKGVVCRQTVAVKIMRLFRQDEKEALLKEFEFGREAVIWRQLSHPNLLPFFGIYYLEERLCLISPWMDNGNIMQYLRSANPGVERRLSLILDVARGLEYLHEKENAVVHGDLKAANIFVTPSHRACIADFGLASVVDAMATRFTHSTTSVRGGTCRYQAPELVHGRKPHLGSDIYAFACVCYEVLTGKVPFHELQDIGVMFKVVNGERPPQPTSCSGTRQLESLWDYLQLCWAGEPETRPTAKQTVEHLQAAPISVTGLSSEADWDNEFTPKFRRSLQLQPLPLSVAQIRRLIFENHVRISHDDSGHDDKEQGSDGRGKCHIHAKSKKVGMQVAAGGFGDICQGVVRRQTVSVKIMRLFHNKSKVALLKEFGWEAVIWRQLSHPNLLPFFGIYYLEERLCLISPWMDNGNIMQYLRSANPGVERRLSLILDVARGLEYLHEEENAIVHGDLKAVNILVTPSHRACIADFGLASVVDAMTTRFTHSTTSVRGGTCCYQAPELFHGEKPHLGSDIYAFACVCYEILTGKVPFHELRDMAVMLRVINGGRPPQPASCSGTRQLESLWVYLQLCWAGEPERRPAAKETVGRLQAAPIWVTGPLSEADLDSESSPKFRRSLQLQPLPLRCPNQAIDLWRYWNRSQWLG